jgi:hypothetical protein
MAEQQRCAIEFCVRLEKSGSETVQLIHQAYGDDAMRRAAVFKWWKRFRVGEMNVKHEPRSGRPSTAPAPLPPEACDKRSAARSREVVERCKKCFTCQGRYFEKDTVTAPPQSSDSELFQRPSYLVLCVQFKLILAQTSCIDLILDH